MFLKCVYIVVTFSLINAEEKKWVWQNNNRDQRTDRQLNGVASARYEVIEDLPSESNYIPIRPGGYYDRPGLGNRPNRPTVVLDPRPGGVYGDGYRPGYGSGGFSEEDRDPGILTGPIPSWVREGPYKNFDTCKCTERFNCRSPGISYGHCDVGKQYCCYTKKENALGGPLPSQPVHSPENGILAGPGGPVDVPRPSRYPSRPLDGRPFTKPGYQRPQGGYLQRPGSFGLGGGSNRPIHSPENGILVGPGGPYDYPQGNGYGTYRDLERSAKKE